MRILVHMPTGLTTPELELMLSRTQLLLDEGQEITILTCAGGKNYACSLNIHGLRSVCAVCKATCKTGIATLQGKYTLLETPAHIAAPGLDEKRCAILKDRWAIKAHEIEGVDVGQAAYSSYVSQARDQDLEGGLARRTLNRLLATSETFVPWFRELLRSRGIEKLIIYNGRQNQYRPLLRVAQQEKLPIDVMEFCGQEARCVYIYRNQLPHNLEMLEKKIEDCWNQFKQHADTAAQSYYGFKRAGGAANDHRSYVLGQTRGLLPEGWDASKHNIAVFSSSEDEFAALGGDYDKTLYLNQTEAMQRLCESLKDDPNIVLWFRMHPNLANVHWSFVERLFALEKQLPNLHVISGASKVSTYDLLDACNTAVSFGSTIGIEAVYWRKPSILIGRCVYERLGSVYTPRTHEEAVALLRDRNLPALPIEGALKIATFWGHGSEPLSYLSGSRTLGFRFRGLSFSKTFAQRLMYNTAKAVEKIVLERWMNYQLGTSRKRMQEYRQHAQPHR